MDRNFREIRKYKAQIKWTAVAVILLSMILGVSAFQKALEIPTQYSFDQFKPKQHPARIMDRKMIQTFKLSETSPFGLLLELKNKSLWTDSENLKHLSNITKNVESMDGVSKVVSLTNFQSVQVTDENFSVEPVSRLIQLRKSSDWIYKDRFLSPNLITRNGKKTLLFVVFKKGLSVSRQSAMMNDFKVAATTGHTQIKASLGGAGAVNTQMAKLLTDEVILFLVLSLVGAVVLLTLVFQGWQAVFISLFIGVVGNLVALGMMSLFGQAFTIFSTTLPILVTITVVAVTTHSLIQLDPSRWPTARGFKLYRYQLKAYRKLIRSHALTAITTSIGFATLIFVDIPVIRDYGISVSSGVLIACAVALALFPALLFFVQVPSVRKSPITSRQISTWIVTYKKQVFLTLSGAVVLMLGLGQDLQWTGKLFNDLPKNHSARTTTDFIGNEMGGLIALEVGVHTPKGESPLWDQPENINKLESLENKWVATPGIGSLAALPDFLKPTSPQRQLPQSKKALAETYFLYGMSYDNPLKKFLTSNHRSTRIGIRLKDVPANQSIELVDMVKRDIKEAFPGVTVDVGGNGALAHTLSNEVSQSLMYGFFQAMVLILLLLACVFRSIKWALVAALPNMVPPIFLLAALSLLGIPIKPGVALIFAISLGIAFDNTVYVLGRLKEMLKQGNCVHRLPIKQLLTEEMSPCFVSSAALMAGFSVFLFSSFEVNQIFGALMLISLIAGLLGDLVLLPATLCLFPMILRSPDFAGNILKGRNDSFNHLKDLISMSRPAASVFLPLLLILQPLATSDAKTHTAKSILSDLRKNSAPPNESLKLNMKIKDTEGDVKERLIVIKRKNGRKAKKTFVRLLSPNNLKGLSILSINEPESENQWLYLPSSQRTRRILGSNKKSRFLDSDLSYEDLQMETYRNFNNTLLKITGKKEKIAVIQSTLRPGKESSYTKIKTWISVKFNRVVKTEYYGESGKLVKVMKFSKYKRYKKRYWRAKAISVEDMVEKRSTLLTLKSVSFKKLKGESFTLSALEDD